MGIQIRSVFLCIYFKTKWMNRSIKVLFIVAYYFFPSLRQFSNSISKKMTRLWRRSNFGANFRFLRKKWTGDLLHPSEQPVIRGAMSGEYGECGKTSHLSVSKYFFTNFSNMRPSVVMKKNNFIMSLLVFRPFFSQRLKRINCSRYRSPVMESSGFSRS